MDRKRFLKSTLIAGAISTISPRLLKASDSSSTYDQLIDQVGFNHLPNKEIKTMKTVIHKANTRGHADHGWLNSHHTFSFANYHNPERMHFGVLRVLNDDIIAGGRGFGTHPHDNMEIISIPLAGALEHKDDMGNVAVINEGDIQVMSAGTGVFHSEYNKSADETAKFLQIWLFPNKKNVTPRYDQLKLETDKKKNELHQILSPNVDDAGVWIHQNAWFSLGDFDKAKEVQYHLNDSTNGVYVFVLSGEVEINNNQLNQRDGMGLWDTDELKITIKNKAKVLLMEVPMQIQ